MTDDFGRASLLQHLMRVDHRSVRVTVDALTFHSRAGSPPSRVVAQVSHRQGDQSIVAPSPGWVVLNIAPGDQVGAGQPVATLRTVKGEQTIAAPCDARVVSSDVVDEQFVGYGAELLLLSPDA